MSKRSPLSMLWLINIGLIAALILVWTLLNRASWAPPAPLLPDYSTLLKAFTRPGHLTAVDYPNLMQAPLFEHDRQWPQPAPQAKGPPSDEPPPPAPDALDAVTVLGIYDHAGAGTIIINANGKDQRLRVGDTYEGWRLQAIEQRTVHFEGPNQQARELTLKRFVSSEAPAAAPPGPRAGAGGNAAPNARQPRPSQGVAATNSTSRRP